jgi:hypothetical protein
MRCTRLFSLFLAGAFCAPALSAWVPTNYGNGADAEVREERFNDNFGASTEIASRIIDAFAAGSASDGSDRNSMIYTRFDLTGYEMPADGKSAFKMTYRNTNLSGSRLQDTVTPNSNFRTGMAVYALKTTAAGQDWIESGAGGITYATAPGVSFPGDSNFGTRDLTTDLQFLGTVSFPAIGTQNQLPVGGELVFTSPNLDNFLTNALAGGAEKVTLVSHVIHDGSAFFRTNFPNWVNFNYLFNPKEQLTLTNHPGYDSDTTNPGNPLGSPWSGASNANGDFSPSLLLKLTIPEPTSAVLCLGALAGLAGVRRRG